MSEHRHAEYMVGCFRCELSRDEAFDALRDEVDELTATLEQVRAEVKAWMTHGPASVPDLEVIWAVGAMQRIATLLEDLT